MGNQRLIEAVADSTELPTGKGEGTMETLRKHLRVPENDRKVPRYKWDRVPTYSSFIIKGIKYLIGCACF